MARKSRMTEEEYKIHEEAVKLRKMTDRQLVGAFRMAAEEKKIEKAQEEAAGITESREPRNDVERLLCDLTDGKVKGIRGATVAKISEYAKDQGMLANG